MDRFLRDRQESSSLASAASLRAARLAQLQQVSAKAINRTLTTIRQAAMIPALRRHLDKHGPLLGIQGEAEYLRALRGHLDRDDLRIFTYLRRRGLVSFWELVAPDDGTAVIYNERARGIWSFFRPKNAEARMKAVETTWVEVVRTPSGWHFEEHWRWRT